MDGGWGSIIHAGLVVYVANYICICFVHFGWASGLAGVAQGGYFQGLRQLRR